VLVKENDQFISMHRARMPLDGVPHGCLNTNKRLVKL